MLSQLNNRNFNSFFQFLLTLLAFNLLFPAFSLSQVESNTYSYTFKGEEVRLNPSKNLLVIQSTTRSKGVRPEALFKKTSLQRNSLSDRAMLIKRGITLLQLPEQGITAKGHQETRESVRKTAEEKSFHYQPVFEQGAALFIPTNEIMIDFTTQVSIVEAQQILAPYMEKLGISNISKNGNSGFLLTIDKPSNGRCFTVSNHLNKLETVDFAEPNHLVIMLDDQTHIDFDNQGVFVDDMNELMNLQSIDQPTNLNVPNQGNRSDLAPNWQVVTSLNGEENSFPPNNWKVVKGKQSADVFWAPTKHRSHSGSNSLYCAGGGGAGVQAPGPVPTNTKTYLLSPKLDLSSFQEAYVEAWFYAKNEISNDPATGKPFLRDTAFLGVTNGKKSFSKPLAIVYNGDTTVDPTTKNGWRKLLYRINPVTRATPVRIILYYLSDQQSPQEGTYVDDIRIIASKKVAQQIPSNDPYSGLQYELRNTGQIGGQGNTDNDMNVLEALKTTTVSPKVIVAVVDDGVDLNHPDLNLVQGYNADGSVGGGHKTTSAKHGTSVAGNIGAIGNNQLGVMGTAPNVKIMPINRGATINDSAQAVRIAASKGAHIINNSWGWVSAPSRQIENAVKSALAAGSIVLFAAGNGPDRPPFSYQVAFPGSMTGYTDVITVGATSQTDEHKSAASSDGFFSWGSSYIGKGPDVCAPGPWSYTTDRVGAEGYNNGSSGVHQDYNDNFGGTSSSTPKVAGIVALMLSVNNTLTPAQVKAILRTTADDIDEQGDDDKTGAGRVNALKAVQMAASMNPRRQEQPIKKDKPIKQVTPKKQETPIPPQKTNEPVDEQGYKKIIDW